MKSNVEALRGFIAGTAMFLSLNAVHASADQSSNIPRIGVVFSSDTSSSMEEGPRPGFRDRGYSENVNVFIDWRRSGETGKELKSLIRELTRLGGMSNRAKIAQPCATSVCLRSILTDATTT